MNKYSSVHINAYIFHIHLYVCAAKKVEHFQRAIDLSCQESLDDHKKAY